MSSYRWIPWVIAGALGVVVAVNGALAYFAVASSTGLVTAHPFESGNGYNRVIDAAAAEDALGWHGALRFTSLGAGRGEIAVAFLDHEGKPLIGLAVSVRLVRPVEPVPDVVLALSEGGAGHYAAAAAPGRLGQWEARVTARRGDQIFDFAQRIVVK